MCKGTFDQVYLFHLLTNTVLRDLNSAQIEQCLWAIWWSQSNFSIRAWMQSIQRLTTSKEEKSHQMPAKIFLIYHNGVKIFPKLHFNYWPRHPPTAIITVASTFKKKTESMGLLTIVLVGKRVIFQSDYNCSQYYLSRLFLTICF